MEVIRCTAVDWDGSLVFDYYVRPENEILCFNTVFSGIRELPENAITLSEVHEKFADIASSKTILSGHGLENDLKVLRICHERIIDTSGVFKHEQGLPHRIGLKALCKRELGIIIQAGEHDSFEDALSCVKLLKSEHFKSLEFELAE